MSEPEVVVENALGSLKSRLDQLILATVALFLVLILVTSLGWYIVIDQRNDIKEVATRTNMALCTFRDDLQQRIDSSKKFLRDHPNGIQGITPEDIQRSIEGQQRTIDSLSILNCP